MLDKTADIPDDRAPPLAPVEAQAEAEAGSEAKARPASRGLSKVAKWLRHATQFFVTQSSSSLTRRIVVLNVAGLLALSIGINYLSPFRARLIDARVQSLLQQGQIIAHAIADQATGETGSAITLDPSKLQNLQTGESYGPSEDALYGIDFPINPERVAPVLRDLVSPTKTRARIYDRDGVLLVDSRDLFGRGDVLRFDLPSPSAGKPRFFQRVIVAVRTWLGRGDLPLYRELGPDDGKGYQEVTQALNGQDASMVRINDRGDVIVSVAVPVQRFRAVRGALMLSTQGADIDNMVTAERLAILKVFLIAAAVMVVLSILLAGTIAEPVRRLADAAESVRRRIQSRVEIPDFTRRKDEIGHLSGALRTMTNALYSRIEGIERFAADVAHELKNPLTSLRSAVETMPLAKSDQSRARLLEVDSARRQAARPPDIGYLGREPARCGAAAPGVRAGGCREVAQHRRDGRQRSEAGRQRQGHAQIRRRRRARLSGARSRFTSRPGDRQPDRKRTLVFAGGRRCASNLPPHQKSGRDLCRR